MEIGATVVKPTDVRDLDVLLDSELTIKRHVSKTVSTPASTIYAGFGAPTSRGH